MYIVRGETLHVEHNREREKACGILWKVISSL